MVGVSTLSVKSRNRSCRDINHGPKSGDTKIYCVALVRWFVGSFVCRRSLSFVRFRSFTFVRSLSFVHFRSFGCSSVTFLPSSESIYQRWCGVVWCGAVCCAVLAFLFVTDLEEVGEMLQPVLRGSVHFSVRCCVGARSVGIVTSSVTDLPRSQEWGGTTLSLCVWATVHWVRQRCTPSGAAGIDDGHPRGLTRPKQTSEMHKKLSQHLLRVLSLFQVSSTMP